MNIQFDWLVQMDYHKELLRQAEKARLAKSAFSALKAEVKARLQRDTQTQPQIVVYCGGATACL